MSHTISSARLQQPACLPLTLLALQATFGHLADRYARAQLQTLSTRTTQRTCPPNCGKIRHRFFFFFFFFFFLSVGIGLIGGKFYFSESFRSVTFFQKPHSQPPGQTTRASRAGASLPS